MKKFLIYNGLSDTYTTVIGMHSIRAWINDWEGNWKLIENLKRNASVYVGAGVTVKRIPFGGYND